MPRLESPALQTAESADAQVRVRASEDRIMDSMVRVKEHAIKRRRAAVAAAQGVRARPVKKVKLSKPQREKIRGRIQELADAAG